MGEWKAFIAYSDQLRRVGKIVIGREAGDQTEYVMGDGSIKRIPAELFDPDVGFEIPYQALAPLAEALITHLGGVLPSEGERKTLREWLAHEHTLVDKLIEKLSGS